MKNEIKINFIIDILMFLVMAIIGGTGLLQKYRLVSGSERWEIYGNNPEMYMLGLDRHQWGYIHLVLGYVLLGLLVLHIIFHWRQIKGILMLLIPNKTGKTVFLSGLVLMFSVFLLFAFISPIVVDPALGGAGRRQADILHDHELGSGRLGQGRVSGSITQGGTEVSPGELEKGLTREEMLEEARIAAGRGQEAPEAGGVPAGRGQEAHREESPDHEEHQLDINGTYTLGEVASRYGVPSDVIKEGLGIPSSTPDGERLGRLRRQYGFTMSDVESIILEYKGEN